MNDELDTVIANTEALRSEFLAGHTLARTILANGSRARLQVTEYEDDRSVQQNRFYWGVVLKEMSEQAVIEGQRWAALAWHELMKRQFLGYEVVKAVVAGRKRPTVYRRLRSTTKLKVKAMAEYLEKVQAFAVTDLNVVFSQNRWEEYR